MLVEKYNTQGEVIVYVPTSHVTLHEADMLSIQLLHDRSQDIDHVSPLTRL